MNAIQFLGNLAQDPEVRYTKTGKAVTTFTVVVDRPAAGVDYIPVVTWDKLAEACGNNLTKGIRIFVQGRLQIRSYETQDHQKRRVAEVVADIVSPQLWEAEKYPPIAQPSALQPSENDLPKCCRECQNLSVDLDCSLRLAIPKKDSCKKQKRRG
jgi:single-strand DNA-binding protein